MRLEETLLQTAKELGFDNYQVIDTAALHFTSVSECIVKRITVEIMTTIIPVLRLAEKQKSWGIRRGRLSWALVLQTITPVKDITNRQ